MSPGCTITNSSVLPWPTSSTLMLSFALVSNSSMPICSAKRCASCVSTTLRSGSSSLLPTTTSCSRLLHARLPQRGYTVNTYTVPQPDELYSVHAPVPVDNVPHHNSRKFAYGAPHHQMLLPNCQFKYSANLVCILISNCWVTFSYAA